MAACGFGSIGGSGVKRAAFSSKEYGVGVSPRVSHSSHPPHGGGRYLLGKPYQVHGQWYTPKEDTTYVASGTASWYGSDFHGRLTANGEIFSANSITGAHPTMPLPSYARVTNLDNGRSIIVRINDRGPYMQGRVVDLSARAADLLGYMNKGMADVQVQYVGPAPLQGDDTRMLLASLDTTTPSMMNQGETRLAMMDPPPQPAPPPPGSAIRVVSTFGNHTETASLPTHSVGTYSSKDLARDFFGLFSYSEGGKVTPEQENQAILNAHDAVNAMATRSTALEDWVATTDENARAIKMQIGVFTDPESADDVARDFAMLGAVDEQDVTASGKPATRLMLTHLKPGVGRDDVAAMAQKLGLKDVVLY
ncbi:MAG TPA: septal ring lytic transglycosylase RlpA family protein [Devosiaceae bacterium]